jgi:hypothetical protein
MGNTTDILARVRDLARVSDDQLSDLSRGPGAQLLLSEILTTPLPARAPARAKIRRPRVRALAAATAAVAAVALAIAGFGWLRPQPAAAGVAFHTDGRYIVADVTDPFAARDSLNAAFQQEGLDIKVNLLPVSPSVVGSVVYVGGSGSDGIQSIQSGACVTGGGGCPVGLRIPRDFSGQADITLGRSARAGEGYASSASAFAPGEELHCSGLLGISSERAAAELRSRGISAEWQSRDGGTRSAAAPNGSYVWSADPLSPHHVVIFTRMEPLTQANAGSDIADLSAYEARLNAGC